MANARKFPIKESSEELKVFRKKQTSLNFEKRVLWLELTLSKRFKTRKELASYLNISVKTQERWVQKYISKGIEGLLSKEPNTKKSKIITPEMHVQLSEKVNSSTAPFLGYWNAVEWVFENFGVEVKYHTLRNYLIKHFKTKLKTPRKSHYKKDEQAEKAFLKTP